MSAARPTTAYVLEGEDEFQRLEDQSRLPAYDYRKELGPLTLPRWAHVLDAGCGSGIVCRYLAERYPDAKIVGVDSSSERLERAKLAASQLRGVSFEVGDVTRLERKAEFDLVLFRYVLQHLSAAGRTAALRGALEALKPGGRIHVIDVDGAFFNFYPKSAFLERCLGTLESSGTVDLHIGRKLVSLLGEAGFEQPACRIEAIHFEGEGMAAEIAMMRRRLAGAAPTFARLLGEPAARKFSEELLAALENPSCVYFQNRFVVTAIRASI